jgi:hypothetical protein
MPALQCHMTVTERLPQGALRAIIQKDRSK